MDPRQAGVLHGKSALITGGTGILGTAMVRTLSRHGCAVAICSRTRDKAEAACKTLRAEDGRAIGLPLDVTDRESIERAADQALAAFGTIDILVNGAGGNLPGATALQPEDFFDLPPEALRGITDLNLLGTIMPSQVVGRHMAAARQGVIINISSMTAIRPLTRVLGYGAAKAAVDNFTRWLAVHMAQNFSSAIRVNAIAPGFFETEQNKFLLHNENGDLSARGQQILDHTPMKRFGLPDDLDGTLIWLVSDMSAFVTGAVIPVDGGFSACAGV